MSDSSTTNDYVNAFVLFVLTCLSTLYVGCQWSDVDLERLGLFSLWRGYPFALPLMTILLSHELGHFIAAKIHRIDASPPYFIPAPFFMVGTMGAIIRMREEISKRDALLDVGAAGPLCGFLVALPILAYGIAISEVQALDPAVHYFVEGRSILYSAMIQAIKGDIALGHDIMLSPPALAGWVGLLVTMINLLPVGQLDGGHVAYALFGPRQDAYARRIRASLPLLAAVITGVAIFRTQLTDASDVARESAYYAGVHWLVWWALLGLMARLSGRDHPPTDDTPLSPVRRVIAYLTLSLFVLLFMPTWMSFT